MGWCWPASEYHLPLFIHCLVSLAKKGVSGHDELLAFPQLPRESSSSRGFQTARAFTMYMHLWVPFRGLLKLLFFLQRAAQHVEEKPRDLILNPQGSSASSELTR